MNDLEKENSILFSVNKNELKIIKYAGVISAFNDFIGVLYSLIDESKKWKCLIKILFCIMMKKKFLFGKTFKENFNKVTEEYKEIMSENIKNDITKIYLEGYEKKDSKFKLDKHLGIKKHDFVIPSSYQLLENNSKGNFYGNFINDMANHNSGKFFDFKAGRINSKLIIKILKIFIYKDNR